MPSAAMPWDARPIASIGPASKRSRLIPLRFVGVRGVSGGFPRKSSQNAKPVLTLPIVNGDPALIVTSPYPDVALSDRTITERVFAGIDPEATILIDGPSGRSLTGAQFMASVKSLAGGLKERGYAPDGCVALMATNMPEFCMAFHGAV